MSEPPAAAMIDRVGDVTGRLREQVGRVVVGQDEVVDQVLIALLARSHALLVGVPGLAKTLLVSTIAKSMSLHFSRVQFTPDLMPSDITGTEVIEEDKATGERRLRFVKGPVFANVILADEINRTPPKTQAALLEAMQERHVTAGGMQHELPRPFFVLATQNPIEQEGTYPLPEAQLDRFMFMIRVSYPTEAEELEVLRRTTARTEASVEPVVNAKEVMGLQDLVRDVPVAEHVAKYALRLVRATRRPKRGESDERPEFAQQYLNWGAGPRASQNLILAGKARALLQGRTHVMAQDVDAVAGPVLRHRLIPNFAAEAEGVTADDIVDRLVETIDVAEPSDPQAAAVLR
ncbi:MAG: MoxR family ATPase [Planctomycetota bacterium]